MTSVDAHSDSALVLDEVNDHLQLLEMTADGVALPRHVLQDNFYLLRLIHSVVNCLGDQPNALFNADCAASRSYMLLKDRVMTLITNSLNYPTWMKVVELYSKLLASLQLIHEEGETLLSHVVFGRAQVE